MPKYLVTQTWVVEPPPDVDDGADYARDYVLSVRPDAENIEEISDQP